MPITERAEPLLKRPRASALIREVLRHTRTPKFLSHLRGLLVELCRIDTTPKADPERMRLAENRCFEILEAELQALGFPGARAERRPIDPAIQNHPHFSQLHFTKTAERPEGLSAESTYAGRNNLVFTVP